MDFFNKFFSYLVTLAVLDRCSDFAVLLLMNFISTIQDVELRTKVVTLTSQKIASTMDFDGKLRHVVMDGKLTEWKKLFPLKIAKKWNMVKCLYRFYTLISLGYWTIPIDIWTSGPTSFFNWYLYYPFHFLKLIWWLRTMAWVVL